MARPDLEKEKFSCCGIDYGTPTEFEKHLNKAHASQAGPPVTEIGGTTTGGSPVHDPSTQIPGDV